MPISGFQGVAVFSATKAKDREALGDKITSWLRANSSRTVVEKCVAQSSDAGFHCLSILLFWTET
jgi:hypothetical protein